MTFQLLERYSLAAGSQAKTGAAPFFLFLEPGVGDGDDPVAVSSFLFLGTGVGDDDDSRAVSCFFFLEPGVDDDDDAEAVPFFLFLLTGVGGDGNSDIHITHKEDCSRLQLVHKVCAHWVHL